MLVSITSASKLSLFFERSFLARGLKNIIAKTEIAAKRLFLLLDYQMLKKQILL